MTDGYSNRSRAAGRSDKGGQRCLGGFRTLRSLVFHGHFGTGLGEG